MEKRGQYDIDHIDLRVAKQLMVVADSLFISKALLQIFCPFQIQIAHRLQPDSDSAHFFIAISMEIRGISRPHSSNRHNGLSHFDSSPFLVVSSKNKNIILDFPVKYAMLMVPPALKESNCILFQNQ